MPNCDFYAIGTDLRLVLELVIENANCRVFESYSPFGDELQEFKTVADIEKRFTLSKCKGVTHSALLQLWPVAASDNVTVRRVDLDPKRCGGHTFRYRIEGWGLIQLYLGGTGPKGIVASHTNHNSEKRARAWEGESDSLGPVSRWDWREVVRVSSQINRHIRTNLAVGKQQSRPILPEAAVAEASGIPLL